MSKNNSIDFSWADGDVKSAALIIASRGAATEIAGPLSDTEAAGKMLDHGNAVLAKSSNFDWSQMVSPQYWSDLYSSDPEFRSALQGALIGGGVGGLGGAAASLSGGGESNLLRDILLGGGMGAAAGGAIGYGLQGSKNQGKEVEKRTSDPTSLHNLLEKEKKKSVEQAGETFLPPMPLREGSVGTYTSPRMPFDGTRSVGGGAMLGAGAMGGLMGLSQAPRLIGQPGLSFSKGLAWKSLLGGGAAGAGLSGISRASQVYPTPTPASSIIDRIGAEDRQFATPDELNQIQSGWKEPRSSLNKRADIGNAFSNLRDAWSNRLDDSGRAAVIGGAAGGLGLGAAGYLGSEKNKVRNAIIAALLGGGVGAGTGYAAYNSPKTEPAPQASGNSMPAATAFKDEQKAEQKLRGDVRSVGGTSGELAGAGAGATGGYIAARRLAPSIMGPAARQSLADRELFNLNTYRPALAKHKQTLQAISGLNDSAAAAQRLESTMHVNDLQKQLQAKGKIPLRVAKGIGGIGAIAGGLLGQEAGGLVGSASGGAVGDVATSNAAKSALPEAARQAYSAAPAAGTAIGGGAGFLGGRRLGFNPWLSGIGGMAAGRLTGQNLPGQSLVQPK
jgi:hypothetical protein